MSSSGGNWAKAGDLAKKMRDAEKKEQDAVSDTEVNKLLADQLADYNNRDTDAIQRILDKIVSDLGDETEGAIDLVFGGSVSKHTYVNGLSDIDALVLLNRTDLAEKSPAELRRLLGQILSERYGKENVVVGDLAVTVKADGHTIQLLPALRDGKGFKISTADGKDWASIRPRAFAETLTKLNTKNPAVVPSIKLVKEIISTLPSKQQLTGYHFEALAVDIFEKYDGPKTHKAMIEHFFDTVSTALRNPITDTTGQSAHVDEYLGTANSPRRRATILALERVPRRIRNANGMRSVSQWAALLGEE